MTSKLEQAAQALLAHWDTPAWKYLKPTGDLMADLREALTEQAEQEPVAERKAQVNELIKESARLIASISDEGDRYLTAIDTLRNAYRLGLKDAALVAAHEREKHNSPSWETVDDAIAAERELCAKLFADEDCLFEGKHIAAAIRARGEK